ncbi:MAG TPA: lytic murein transglycosylase [Xanthobacteraceae bacterium]
MSVLRRAWFAACFLLALSASASAVPCGSGSFEGWLESFKREAAAQGISARSIASALNGVSYDPGIVSRDHAQGVFRQSFEQFAGRMVSAERLQKGAGLLRRHPATQITLPVPNAVAETACRPFPA